MNLYFECNSGISGDMSVGALLDLGADKERLKKALESMKLDNEFSYVISKKAINGIMGTDFDVILQEHKHNNHHHIHRNLDDINKIIDIVDMTNNAKVLAKKIFEIVAQAESKVHGKDINEIHFHEIGAIDSIVDIISFSVLFDSLNPQKVYISTLCDGFGFVNCQHGTISVPVPAVCEIASKYKLPLKITDNNGEMITPTGAAIISAIYNKTELPNEFIIEKIGYGTGKRNYKSPFLRVMSIN